MSILDYAKIEEDVFDQVLRELTADLPTTSDGLVKVETNMIDQCLEEIVRPELRLRLWKARQTADYLAGMLQNTKPPLDARTAI